MRAHQLAQPRYVESEGKSAPSHHPIQMGSGLISRQRFSKSAKRDKRSLRLRIAPLKFSLHLALSQSVTARCCFVVSKVDRVDTPPNSTKSNGIVDTPMSCPAFYQRGHGRLFAVLADGRWTTSSSSSELSLSSTDDVRSPRIGRVPRKQSQQQQQQRGESFSFHFFGSWLSAARPPPPPRTLRFRSRVLCVLLVVLVDACLHLSGTEQRAGGPPFSLHSFIPLPQGRGGEARRSRSARWSLVAFRTYLTTTSARR